MLICSMLLLAKLISISPVKLYSNSELSVIKITGIY